MVHSGALVAGCVTTDHGISFVVTHPVTKKRMIFVIEGEKILGEVI